jgi:BirA family biotin operon repressor/biotin-[acetyl-CoA-carboxylase] ligase
LKFQIFHFDVLDSTNEWLKRAAAFGQITPGAVVRAGYQTSGRGRLGRTWEALPEAGLLFSMLLDPPLGESHLPLLGMLVSLGLTDGLSQLLTSPDRLELRWPNDILFDGRKLCGILSESTVNPAGRKLAVVGVGLNVNQTEADFPDNFRTPAISLLQISGNRVAPVSLLPKLLRAIASQLERLDKAGWRWIAGEWLEKVGLMHRTIEIADGDTKIKGIVSDILEDGALVLTMDNGIQRIVRTGVLNRL